MTCIREWKLGNLTAQRAKTIPYYFYMTRLRKRTIRNSINDSVGTEGSSKAHGKSLTFQTVLCLTSSFQLPFSEAMKSGC